MTTSPPQPPQNPYPGQPGGYGPPPEQFPQYTQPHGQQHGQQPPQQYQQQPSPQQAPQQGQSFPQQGQSFPQQGQFPQHQGQPMPQATVQCRFCGGIPAVQATVRGHQGMIVVMRFLKLQGPFCRTCGIASVRDMTAKSLWQGWWGIGSAIVNPITMLMNLEPWAKFRKLPEPAPGAPGRPMNPGKPLIQRPAIAMLLLPIALIATIVVINLNITTPSEAAVGSCVVNKGSATSPEVDVVDCASSEAEYKVVGKLDNTIDDSQCAQFPGYEAAYTSEVGSQRYTLCLGPI
ncbi:toxin-antitoxin system, toxin component [Kribbella sp. NPDC023972]|uniref:LppU/SCO3897 family protein n=1 Tax=Kribbella sp. NPDC023972 TaxID=3154795 RepID=UPI0033EE9B78